MAYPFMHGTTYGLVLPLIDAPLPRERPAHVLVVEDEVLIRMIISDGLRDAGYSVIEAMNGDEAVEILKSGACVDLVFSDVRMPGEVDGIGLLGFIQEAFPVLPVVITSGHLRSDMAITHGAAGFVSKPYQIDAVVELIGGKLSTRL